MWSLWQMSAGSRCLRRVRERERERDGEGEKEREREKARVFTIQEDHDPYTRLAPNAYEVGGRRDPRCRLSASAAEQMNECGRTRDWRGKSAPLRIPLHPLLSSTSLFLPRFSSPAQHKDSWLREIQTVLRQNWSRMMNKTIFKHVFIKKKMRGIEAQVVSLIIQRIRFAHFFIWIF